MRWMHQILQERFDRENLGRIVYNPKDYPDEFFYNTERPRTGPLLMSKAPIPGSTRKDGCAMADHLNNYLRSQVFQGFPDSDLPIAYQEAAKEWREERKALEKLLSSNWQEASRKIAQLQLFQKYVSRPAEALGGLVASLLINREQRLQDIYTVTNAGSADGGLVYVGNFDSNGASVYGWDPRFDRPNVGVCLAAEPKNLGF